MNPKLTPWFPSTVKPVHVGVYRTNLFFSGRGYYKYSYWDGKKWGWSSTLKERANPANGKDYGMSPNQCKQWRGLAVKP